MLPNDQLSHARPRTPAEYGTFSSGYQSRFTNFCEGFLLKPEPQSVAPTRSFCFEPILPSYGPRALAQQERPASDTTVVPSRRDRVVIAQRFSVGITARVSQVPKGRLGCIHARQTQLSLPAQAEPNTPSPPCSGGEGWGEEVALSSILSPLLRRGGRRAKTPLLKFF